MSKDKASGAVLPFAQGTAFFLRRGDAHFEEGDLLDALGLYIKAAAYEPENEKAWLSLAETYSSMGLYELSNKSLLSMTWRCGSLPSGFFYRLGCNFVALQEYEVALECFSRHADDLKSSAESPESDELLQLLSNLEFSDSEGAFPEGDASENGARIIAHHGEIMLRKGNAEGAISLLKHAHELAPDLHDIEVSLALAYWTTQKYDMARELCENAVNNDPEEVRAYCLLANIANITGDDMLLARCIEAMVNIEYTLISDAFQAAITLGELGRHHEAEPLIKSCLFDSPYDVDMLHAYAVNAYTLKNAGVAAQIWDRIHKMIPKDPVADYYYLIGRDAKQKEDDDPMELSYSFELPEVEVINKKWIINAALKRPKDAALDMEEERQLKAAVAWAMEYGDDTIQSACLPLVPIVFKSDFEALLRDYILQDKVSEKNKDSAMMHLHQQGIKGPYIAMMNGSIIEVSYWDLSSWEQFPKGYGDTIKLLLESCAERSEYEIAQDAIKIWRGYVESYPGKLPLIRKPENYAAALEYIVRQSMGLSYTQREIAEAYEAAVSGVARSIYNILHVLPELLQDSEEDAT